MGFDKIPAELQIEIFSYLDNTDLKAVRRVNASCRDNASPRLFQSIIACARYQAMGGFQNIALHPIYQKYVKEILFDATAYERRFATNRRSYEHFAQSSEHLREVVGWDRHSRWKQYQSLYHEQEQMKEGILLQTVARALEWMPNVESITYCSYERHLPVESKIVKDLLPRALPSPAFDTSSAFAQHAFGEIPENGFHHLIGAVSLAEYLRIREFRVQSRYNTSTRSWTAPWCALGEFWFREPRHLESGKYFFRNLRKIDLDIDLRLGPKPRECLANMRALLSEARSLGHLHLHIQPSYNIRDATQWLTAGESISPFAALGLATYWPNIQSIDLGHIIATEDELKGLLSRLKETLISTKFTNCVITSGKWSNLTDEVLYNTKVSTYILLEVHEEFVPGGVPFESLHGEQHQKWQYDGHLRENAQGERCFWERPGKSVYAWHDFSSG